MTPPSMMKKGARHHHHYRSDQSTITFKTIHPKLHTPILILKTTGIHFYSKPLGTPLQCNPYLIKSMKHGKRKRLKLNWSMPGPNSFFTKRHCKEVIASQLKRMQSNQSYNKDRLHTYLIHLTTI